MADEHVSMMAVVGQYNSGSSMSQLAERHGVNRGSIRKKLDTARKGGVVVRIGKSGRPLNTAIEERVPEIIDLYNCGSSISQLAKRYGVSCSLIQRRLVMARKGGALLRIGKSGRPRNAAIEERVPEIVDQYNSGSNMSQLAERYGVSCSLIQRRLNMATKNGVVVRTRKRGRQRATDAITAKTMQPEEMAVECETADSQATTPPHKGQ